MGGRFRTLGSQEGTGKKGTPGAHYPNRCAEQRGASDLHRHPREQRCRNTASLRHFPFTGKSAENRQAQIRYRSVDRPSPRYLDSAADVLLLHAWRQPSQKSRGSAAVADRSVTIRIRHPCRGGAPLTTKPLSRKWMTRFPLTLAPSPQAG